MARVAFAAILVAALGFMIHVSLRSWRGHHTVPNLDDWRMLDGFFSEPFLPWLFREDKGHRIPVTLLLLALDYTWMGGHLHLLTLVAIGCAWLTFGTAWGVLRPVLDSGAWPVVLAFTGVALFWAGDCFDFVWGTNHGSQQATLLLFGALAALATAQRRRLESGRLPVRPLVVASLAAVGATFSQGIGFATWGAVVAVAIVARFPWRATAVLAAGAAVTFALFTLGVRMPGSGTIGGHLVTLTTKPWLLPYVEGFVGITPRLIAAGLHETFPRGTPAVGLAAGTAGLLGLSVYAAWLLRLGTRVPPPDIVACGLMTFVTFGAVIVGLMRGPWLLSVERFVTWSTLFWIGAAWALGRFASRRLAAAALAVVLIGASLVAHPASESAHRSQRLRDETLMSGAYSLVLGLEVDSEAVQLSWPRIPELVYRVAARFRRDRRNFVADPFAELPGAPIDRHFVRTTRERCAGDAQLLVRVDTRGTPAITMAGRGLETATRTSLSLVVVTDGNEIIRGLGGARIPRPGGDGFATVAHWVGFLPYPQAHERYVVHGVLADRRSACPIAEIRGDQAAAALRRLSVRPAR